MRRIAGAALLGAAALALPGCASVDYLLHAAGGHLSLLAARRPIERVVADPATPEALARRLEQVQRMRRFAAADLALPVGGSYRDYVDVGRESVVWSVTAAPALSLEPRTWCYPVVGCVSYRGFFDLASAGAEASRLRAQGLDVYVAPVQAYSTLGWFDDPMPSTLMRGPPWHTAGVMFHELAHQRVYAAGDTAFSEAYAVAVQREGERRWLARHGTEASRAAYRRHMDTREAFLAMVRATRAELEGVYTSRRDDAAKRAAKAAALRELRARYAALRARVGANRGLDRWFGQDLNNAKLALVATYNDLVPRFEALLASLGGDMEAFHREVERLARLERAARRAGLPRAAS